MLWCENIPGHLKLELEVLLFQISVWNLCPPTLSVLQSKVFFFS